MDFLHTDIILRLPLYFYRYCKRTKQNLVDLNLGIYWFWVTVRFGLTLFPQTGYLHPDEFFQTVEVFAGNVFDAEVSVPWEFNASFPIRSVPLIYICMSFPLTILRRVDEFIGYYTEWSIISHFTLLVLPRMSMCFLSFVSDVCLFKICHQFCQNYKERLIIYASSFVCLVFMTRTFTNTIETTCFNVLLMLVASCMAESEKVNYQSNYLKDKYNVAASISEQVKVTKLMKLLPKHSLKQCIPIAFATVSGIFNRPTFVFFAFTPLFYWFQRGITMQSSFLKDFHVRIFVFIMHCLPFIFIFIFLDSAYYGYITWGEIINLKIGFNNFVITPLNFIKYNLDSSNLSKHGLHPRFLHLLINIPLLFNVLGLSGLIVVTKMIYRSSLSNWTLLPKSQSITGMMTLSFIVPLAGLSIFPHQEPRFIIPVLLPLVFLYSHLIHDFDEHSKTVIPFRKRYPNRHETVGVFKYPLKCIQYLEKITADIDNRYNINGRYLTRLRDQEIVEAKKSTQKAEDFYDSTVKNEEYKREIESQSGRNDEEKLLKKKKDLMKYWFAFNGFCVLFFGFLHQGGIYHLSRDLHQKLAVKPKYTTYHLITSHVYSLPLHLLMIKRSQRYKNTNFVAYEMGASDQESISLKLSAVLKLAESRKKSVRRNYRVFYAFPASLFNEFKEGIFHYSHNYRYRILDTFYPHLSTEALPNLRLNLTVDSSDFAFPKVMTFLKIFDGLLIRYFVEFFRQFGLMLVEITLSTS